MGVEVCTRCGQHGVRRDCVSDAREHVERLPKHRIGQAEFGEQCTQRGGPQSGRQREPQPGGDFMIGFRYCLHLKRQTPAWPPRAVAMLKFYDPK